MIPQLHREQVLAPQRPLVRPKGSAKLSRSILAFLIVMGVMFGATTALAQAINFPPGADAGPDVQANEGDLIHLDGSNSFDPDFLPMTYLWTQIAGPTAIITNQNSAVLGIEVPYIGGMGGVMTFQLTVTDSGWGTLGNTLTEQTSSDTADVIITRVAPVAIISAPASVNEGATVTLDGSQSYDPNNAPLTYHWWQFAGTPVTLDLTDPVRPTFTAPITGVGDILRFELTVVNDHYYGSRAYADIQVTVANQDFSFSPAAAFVAGASPYSVATGDLNGDGSLDLAVANRSGSSVSILPGTGTGTFGTATHYAVGAGPISVAIGDVNADGRPDLAVASFDNSTVSILLGAGMGTFGAATPFVVGSNPWSVAIGDVNADSRPDLAVANYSSGTVSILFGTGNGAFGAATHFAVGSNPRSVAIGDVNGDGWPDLAVANFGSNTVSVLFGTGAGGFGAASHHAVGSGPVLVAVGDLNEDGRPDLAVANYGSNSVSVLVGTGAGAFGVATDFPARNGPRAVEIEDLNGDGRLDLVVANGESNTVSILLGAGDGTFGPATDFAAGNGPHAVAIGDLNEDGRPDLAVANSTGNTISILVNTTMFATAGAFSSANNQPVGTNPYAVATGDLNGDGRLDLAVAKGSGTMSVLLGDGTGAFGVATNFPVGGNLHSVAIGDLNGDGRLDLATADLGGNTVAVLLGDGTGAFGAATKYSVGSSPIAVAIGDLNGDGRLDLVVANSNSSSVSILLGDGTGAFAAATHVAVGSIPYSVAIGDLNGDGRPDLAVANLGSGRVSVLLGTGAGAFGAATAFSTAGSFPYSVAMADLNKDGRLDLAVANYSSNTVAVLLGDGTGAFGAATTFAVGTNPSSVAIADLNRDGRLDLVVANSNSSSVSILLGDGTGAFGAATSFTSGASPFSVTIADLNRDGRLDLATANQLSGTASVLLNTGPVLSAILAGRGNGTVASTPAGLTCPSTCSTSFNSGTEVTMAAMPAPESVFAGWSGGGCSGTGTCTVTLTSDTTVTATFTPLQYALSLSKFGTGAGTVTSSPGGITCGATCSASFDSGTSVSLTAIPDPGSAFDGWTGACSGTSTCTVRIDATKSVTATFTLVNRPPVANAGADMILEATGSFGASVTLDGSASLDPDGDALRFTWNWSPSGSASGATPTVTLPLGEHTLILTVEDGLTSATDTVRIIVQDTTPPTLIGVPADIAVLATSGAGAAVTYAPPTATDAVDPTPVIVCSPGSGMTFPIGTTVVSCQASDASGNGSSAGFNVTVVAPDLDTDGLPDVADPCPSDPTNTCDPNGSAAATIDASTGGTVTTPDGSVSVSVPPGALAEDTTLSITDTGSTFELNSNLGQTLGVFGIEILPEGTTFNTPITLVFTWPDVDNNGVVDGTNIREESLRITKNNVAITGKCKDESGCDAVANTFAFTVSSLSHFVLAGPLDSDGDGLPNQFDGELDVCPTENSTGFDADQDGCIDTLSGLATTVATLVASEVIAPELQNSLLSKIDNAEQSSSKENLCAAVNELGAFKNQIAAQKGKKISDAAAVLLTDYANNVIAKFLEQLQPGDMC